jgi:hypothetical protein
VLSRSNSAMPTVVAPEKNAVKDTRKGKAGGYL